MSAQHHDRRSPTGLLRQLFAGLPAHTRTTFAIRIAAVGLEFLCLLVLARLLDPEAYGPYALAMTFVAIFAVPAAVGLDRLVVRELAAFQALDDWPHAHGLLRSSVAIVLAASAIAAVATWGAGKLTLGAVGPDQSRALLVAAALVPILALARLRQAALQGLGQVTAGIVPEFLLQPGLVIALALASAFMPFVPRTAAVAVGFQLAAAGIAFLAGAWLLRRHLPGEIRQAMPRFQRGRWWNAGLAFMALVMMTTVLTNVDTVLVGSLRSAGEAGTYKVATQLAMLVGLPLTAVSVALAPGMAALHAAGRSDELQRQSRAAARVIIVSAMAVAAAVSVGGPRILGAFGPSFATAYVPTLVLVAAYLLHSAMATSGYLLIMSAHEKPVLAVFAGGAALNVLGGLALIPRFGLIGAASSSAICLCLVSISCAWLARRRLGIDGTVFARLPGRSTTA